VHSRAAAGPDRGQEPQADAELVELPAAHAGQARLLPLELAPGDHAADVTLVLLTPDVSISV